MKQVMSRLLMVALACVVTAAARGMFAMPTDAPVPRLVQNAEAYVLEHPTDATGYYVLARVHYLAWSIGTGRVPTYGEGEANEAGERPLVALPGEEVLGMFSGPDRQRENEAQRRVLEKLGVATAREVADQAEFWGMVRDEVAALTEAGWAPDQMRDEAVDYHAERALTNLKQAIARDAENGLYWLTLASITEEYADRGHDRGLLPSLLPVVDGATAAEAGDAWRAAAMSWYEQAYAHSAEEDAGQRFQPMSGYQSMVSYEAAVGYQRLAEAGIGGADAGLMQAMAEQQKRLEALQRGPITPMVFALDPRVSIDGLVDRDARVSFDLDGSGRVQAWSSWPTADAMLLCWDPRGTGEITSGRQLFGSATWWVLPPDGYRALDLLDDNRDGELTGDELVGLSAWCDADGDAVSSAGEVRTLAELGVASIATRPASATREGWLSHPMGLRMSSGRVVPTVDWVAEPEVAGE